MLSKEQEEQAREIAKDIAERAENGEFGWVNGVNGIPWNIYQEFREVGKRFMPFIDEDYEDEDENNC